MEVSCFSFDQLIARRIFISDFGGVEQIDIDKFHPLLLEFGVEETVMDKFS